MTNKEKIKKAIECAKGCGFDGASYVGERKGKSVYQAGFDNGKDAVETGLPCFVVVDDKGNAEESFGFEFMDMVKDE